MKILTPKNILIGITILVIGFLIYKTNYYKDRYEQTKNWSPPYFCSDENLKAISFLLNSEDNPYSQARAVVALKDSGCFYDYPTLVSSAQRVVEKESEVVKAINNTEIASVELLVEFEKDPLQLFQPKDEKNNQAVLELTEIVTIFKTELDKRMKREIEKLWQVENLDEWEIIKEKTEEIDYLQTYIPKDNKSGSCWTTSIASANDKAWRCIAGNSIHDPCFAIDTNRLVCDVDPEVSGSGFVLNLTETLPSRGNRTNQERFYWIVKLANGTKCWLITGTAGMVNGEFYYYACDKDNAVIIGKLDKSTNPWYAEVAYLKENREEALRTDKTEILKVWK